MFSELKISTLIRNLSKFKILLVFFVFGISQSQASSLPACEGLYWSPCYGSYTYFFGNYIGEFKFGVFHGKGTYTWDDGKKYQGEWDLGSESGYGTLVKPNGDKYEGEWAHGLPNGQGIFFYGPNSEWPGHIYNGEYKDDKRQGKGTYSWPNGDKYVGEWKDDIRHGHGTFTLATGDKYVGEWKDNIKHGHGSYDWPNGDKYIGYFKNNQPNGWGKIIYRNGGKYLGEFKNGYPNGQGKQTSWIGIVKEGIWKDGNIVIKKKIEIEPELNPEEFNQTGSGTGFVVSKKGHIISNYHVVEGCSQILIHTEEKTYKGIIIAVDKDNDLSLLQGDFKPKVVFPLSDNQPSLMQDIYVAGFPFGNYYSSSVKVTKGIISSLLGIGDNTNVIQFDAAVQPGNSGGPILDEYGNVVGVTYALLSKLNTFLDLGAIPENVNFGIKVSEVENLLMLNNVRPKSANNNKISKLDLGYKIKKGTFNLSCWAENTGLF